MRNYILRRKFIHILLLAATFVAGGWLAPASAEGLRAPDAVWTDGFGYQLSNTDTTAWVEANGGTKIDFPNMIYTTEPTALPFSFKFYEGTFTQIWVSKYGQISFNPYSSVPAPNKPIPFSTAPNNVVAPLWAGLDFSSVEVYLLEDAPNNRVIIEWELIEIVGEISTMRVNFEVILEGNTNAIWFQYKTLDTGWERYPETLSVGIEDGVGINGLEYPNTPLVDTDLHFTRPAGATKRVRVSPRYDGGFAVGGKARFQLTIHNNGNLNNGSASVTDVYKLQWSSTNVNWQGTFNGAGGLPLTDTNGDNVVDTGPVSQGSSKIVYFYVAAPLNAQPGDDTNFTITATSTDVTKSFSVKIQSAVPTEFAQIYLDSGQTGLRIDQIWKENVIGRKILGFYEGSTFSMKGVSADAYLSAWEDFTNLMLDGRVIKGGQLLEDGRLLYQGEIVTAPLADGYTEIAYRMTNRFTGPGPVRVLTNMVAKVPGGFDSRADARSLAVADSMTGSSAVAWREVLQRRNASNVKEYNANLFLTVLNTAGTRISDLYNLTNDTGWYSSSRLQLYHNVVITGDQKFGVCWMVQFTRDVRCGFYYLSAGSIAKFAGSPMLVASYPPPPPPSTGTTPIDLTVAPLPFSEPNNRILVAYFERTSTGSDLVYSIWDKDGNKHARTLISGASGSQPRAVQFLNQNTLIVWIATDGRLAYVMLDNSYGVIGSPGYLEKVDRRIGADPSLTLDRNQRALVTWLDGYDFDALFYALFDDNGTVLTPPMSFVSDVTGNTDFLVNKFGFSNAGYTGVYPLNLPLLFANP